jgi:tRNA(His) guanylyltransferase
LVQEGGLSNAEAHLELKGTFSKDKHEILHSRFGINYNNEPEVFKRGTIIIRLVDKKQLRQIKKSKN